MSAIITKPPQMTSRATYLERSSGVKVVEKVIKDVLDAYLHNVKYDSLRCSHLSRVMCAVIKDKVKELDDDADEDVRHKLVVHVMVGQDANDTVLLSSRCLWSTCDDSMASATYRNNWLFAVGVVFSLSS